MFVPVFHVDCQIAPGQSVPLAGRMAFQPHFIMPWKPQKPCASHGCGRLTDGRFCDVHRAAAEAARRPAARALYGAEWRRASAAFVRGKLCVCGCGQPATVTDHKRPHRGDRVLFWDRTNWQPMAKRCHDRKTGGGETIARPAVKGCDANGTPLDQSHPWNRPKTPVSSHFSPENGKKPPENAPPQPRPRRTGRGGAKV